MTIINKLFFKRKIILALMVITFTNNSYSSIDLIDEIVGDRSQKAAWLNHLSNLLKAFEGDKQAKDKWILENPSFSAKFIGLLGNAKQQWDSFVSHNDLDDKVSSEDANKHIGAYFLREKSNFLYQYTLDSRPLYTNVFTDGIFGELLDKKTKNPNILNQNNPNFQVEVVDPLNRIFTAIGQNLYHPILNCFKTLFDPALREFKLGNGDNIYDTHYSNFLNYPPTSVEGLRLSLECLQIGKRRPSDEIIHLLQPLMMPFIPVHTLTFLNVLEKRASAPWPDGTPYNPYMFFDALRRICALGEDLNSLGPYMRLKELFQPEANPIALRNRLTHTTKINSWIRQYQDNEDLYKLIEKDLKPFSTRAKSYLNARSQSLLVSEEDKKWEGFEKLRDDLVVVPSKPNLASGIGRWDQIKKQSDEFLKTDLEKLRKINDFLKDKKERRTKLYQEIRTLIALGTKDLNAFNEKILNYPVLIASKDILISFIKTQKEVNNAQPKDKKDLNQSLKKDIDDFIERLEPLDKNLEIERVGINQKQTKLEKFCKKLSPTGGFSNMKTCYAEFLSSFNNAFNFSEASSFSWEVSPATEVATLFHLLHNIPLDIKDKLLLNQRRINERLEFISNIRQFFNVSEKLEDLLKNPDEIVTNYTKDDHLVEITTPLRKLQDAEAGTQGALEFLVASFYDQLNAITDCSADLETVYETGKLVRNGIFHSIFADSTSVSGMDPKDIIAREGAILMVNVFYLLQKESQKIATNLAPST